MDLQHVSARGIEGLALFPDQALSFDFGALEDGVYAVVGGNGQGKTTLLELPLAALYSQFPSRPDNTLIDSADGKGAFIDVTVDIAGRGRYRARVNIDAVTRATDAVLELTTPDGVTRALNDGKISSFKLAVAQALPSLALILASAFAAQTKTGSFSELGKKDRRDLFAQLLGLEVYEAYAQTARDAALILDKRLGALSEILRRLRDETSQVKQDEIGDTGNALQADLGAAEYAERDASAAVGSLETALDGLQKQAARYVAADAERTALLARRADREREHRQILADVATVTTDAAADQVRLTAEAHRSVGTHESAIAVLPTVQALDRQRDERLETLETRLANLLHAKDLKIQNNRALLSRHLEIRAAVQATHARQQEHAAAAAQLADARHAVQDADRRLKEARGLVAAAGDPAGLLARATQDAALIASVPFGEKCAQAGCQFVQQALEARARIPELEASVEALERLHIQETVAVEAGESADVAVAAIQTEVDRLLVEIGRLAPVASELAQLEASEARVKELVADQQQLREQAETDRADIRAQRDASVLQAGTARTEHLNAIAEIRAALPATLAAADARWTEKRTALEARAQALLDTIAELGDQANTLAGVMETNRTAHDQLVTTDALLRSARGTLALAVSRLATITQQVQAFEARRVRFLEQLGERERLEAAVTRLQDLQAAWDVHAAIFGREGLPVLEIDAAGPGVSALANDLLSACFGSRFQIELITQEPKADGKGFKEVFDVRVTDGERGTEPDLADLSGGERVIVDEALRSAIALYINQRNEQPILTCWRDETVGALDPENAIRYAQMLRRVRERGGFRKVLYISHNPEASAMADGQIVIANGTIRVDYPPFSRSEAA